MPRRSKARVTFILSLWVLLFVIIIGVVTPVRDIVLTHLFPPATSSVTPIPPGDNLFYIQESPRGSIDIDGHPATHLPDMTKTPPDAPLRLSRGKHQIVWISPPFKPVVCAVSVPSLLSNEICNNKSVIAGPHGQNVRLISFTATYSDLPNVQQAALKQHIQGVLDALQATDMVQPGEQYLFTSPAGLTSPVVATQPLKATLSYHLDTSLTSNRACVNGYGDTCTYNGQNCLELCVFTNVTSQSGVELTGPDWYAIALFYPTWTYRTGQGTLLGTNQTDAAANQYVGIDHSVLLHILWTTKGWQVNIQPVDKTLPEIDVIYDPACMSLVETVQSLSTYQITHESNPQNVHWEFYAGTNHAAGCLGVATPQQTYKPFAYFLYRFGVMLAANTAAHHDFPTLPVADASEQAIAQQIANEAGV